MSQTITLFSIPEEYVQNFIAYPEKVGWANIAAVAKSNIELHGSLEALEYLLTKERPDNDRHLIREIFNPDKTLGESLDEAGEDYVRIFELLESGKSVPYISKQKVEVIHSLLGKITSDYIAGQYNADELNSKDIYPSIWHEDNTPDKVFNLHHLLTDFELIKNLFATAIHNGDSIASIVS